ncbi:MAG: sigma-54 dependent transcriptional regulator [Erythrobacteraceae bacterium]|jgi:two-component system C4-dicarboxylate transport response regulator DctD|nr:sigma-54 dependent transcriptional regulator [Erythrobacteraceae bacterium]
MFHHDDPRRMTSSDAPLHVVLVEDDTALRDATTQALVLEGADVVAFQDAHSALAALSEEHPGVVVSDIRMPGMDGLAFFARLRDIDPELPVILTTGHGDIAMAVEALKNGAADFLTKPYSSADLIRAVRVASGRRALALENRRLREELGRSAGSAIIGTSSAAQKLRSVIEAVARSEIDIVLTGEAGTGKSFAARLIHDLGPRRTRPFVTIDAEVLTHEDAELLLFGRDPGAGLSRTGLAERANGGTLFLDGIDAVTGQLRTRLMALLEKRNVLPIGADRARPLNLRIIIARHPGADENGADLHADTLEHKLGAISIALPPLAARREDIPEIFRHFVIQHARELGQETRTIGEAQWRHVQTHAWPGNLHELNGYARAFMLGLTDLDSGPAADGGQRSLQQILADFECTVLADALRQCRGDVTRLQDMLQTPRKTIYDKLARHNLRPGDFRQG